VDVLGLLFSVAALYGYLQYQATHCTRRLIRAIFFALLAVFTKQTLAAAGAAILLSVAKENRRRAVLLGISFAGVAAGAVFLLNRGTGGGFLENTVLANINPFSRTKLWEQMKYFLPVAAAPLAIALAQSGLALRRGFNILHLYLAASAAIFFLTGPKIGADLNYQLETMVALGLCAGWSLHELRFFPECFRGSPKPVTLLQAPFLVYVLLNFVISGKILASRVLEEGMRRQEYEALRCYLEPAGGRVISVQLDPLVQSGRPIEVEPLIYTLLVKAGRLDVEPVRRDLSGKKFSLVILYEDLSKSGLSADRDPELPSLPPAALQAIRENYKLLRHIPGPLLDGDYLYIPAGERGR
jgi:hypothetical protein